MLIIIAIIFSIISFSQFNISLITENIFSVNDERKEVIQNDNPKKNRVYDYKNVNKINYVENQNTFDNLFGFDIEINETSETQIKLKLQNYFDFNNPDLYVYVYQSGTKFSIENAYKNYRRANGEYSNNNTRSFDKAEDLDLNDLRYGLYKTTPKNIDNDGIITIKGQDVSKNIYFTFLSDEINNEGNYKGIKWSLYLEDNYIDDNIKINNILRQKTSIMGGKKQIENYYQSDGLGGIMIMNE